MLLIWRKKMTPARKLRRRDVFLIWNVWWELKVVQSYVCSQVHALSACGMCFEYQSTTITSYVGRFLTIVVVVVIGCCKRTEWEAFRWRWEIPKTSYPCARKRATVHSSTCLWINFLTKSLLRSIGCVRFFPPGRFENDRTIKIYDRKYIGESLSNQYGSLIACR